MKYVTVNNRISYTSLIDDLLYFTGANVFLASLIYQNAAEIFRTPFLITLKK
jgi:hypothetical protein